MIDSNMFVYQRKTFPAFIPLLIFLFLIGTGCFTVTVRNYPVNKPFVYETQVQVSGDLKSDEKKDLEAQLQQQLHDSVRVRTISKAIGWDNGPKFFYEVLKNPVPFDSLNAAKSVQFMEALLNSLGYYRDSIDYVVDIDTLNEGRQLRTKLTFHVFPNMVTRLDSIAYRMNADTTEVSQQREHNLDTLQRITQENQQQALIKKGDPFSKYKISAERDRLADLYRNNGYLRFSEEEVLVLWDTVGIELLRPTLDPIEQARQLQALARRRANPVADIEFRLRENPDSTRITRYYIGKVTIYPDITADTTTTFLYQDSIGPYQLRYNQYLFKKRIFPAYIFLNPGDLYRQSNYLKTQNKFNALDAWRYVNIIPLPRPGQDTADFEIRLTPARKYGFTTNVEISRNQGNISIAQGNLLGLGFTAGVQNRNFLHGANQAITNFRFGTELNATTRDLIQTRQITISNTFQFPRMVPRIKLRHWTKENTINTIFTLNGGITDRRDYFLLNTLNTSWGYQFGGKNTILGIRFPNIEYNYLIRRDSLDTLIARNASYKYIFNTGLITSVLGNFSKAFNREKVTGILSFSGELSGLLGLVKSRALNTNLYQFLKFDLEYRQTRNYFRNAFAWRVFGGVGWSTPGPTDGDTINRYLPFFREYFAGGPNSMRAWSVRKLGPGSAIKSFNRTVAPDRFGDIRFEANAEYRFFLFNYSGISFNSALYTDIGNVWFLRYNPDFPGGEFPRTFAKFWKDLAIGVGTGLRVDFGFLKVRVDYAYKAKDPTPEDPVAQNKWFYNWAPLKGQIQLGIDYPF